MGLFDKKAKVKTNTVMFVQKRPEMSSLYSTLVEYLGDSDEHAKGDFEIYHYETTDRKGEPYVTVRYDAKEREGMILFNDQFIVETKEMSVSKGDNGLVLDNPDVVVNNFGAKKVNAKSMIKYITAINSISKTKLKPSLFYDINNLDESLKPVELTFVSLNPNPKVGDKLAEGIAASKDKYAYFVDEVGVKAVSKAEENKMRAEAAAKAKAAAEAKAKADAEAAAKKAAEEKARIEAAKKEAERLAAEEKVKQEELAKQQAAARAKAEAEANTAAAREKAKAAEEARLAAEKAAAEAKEKAEAEKKAAAEARAKAKEEAAAAKAAAEAEKKAAAEAKAKAQEEAAAAKAAAQKAAEEAKAAAAKAAEEAKAKAAEEAAAAKAAAEAAKEEARKHSEAAAAAKAAAEEAKLKAEKEAAAAKEAAAKAAEDARKNLAKEQMKQMLKDGMPPKLVAKYTGFPEEEVQKVADVLKLLGDL